MYEDKERLRPSGGREAVRLRWEKFLRFLVPDAESGSGSQFLIWTFPSVRSCPAPSKPLSLALWSGG